MSALPFVLPAPKRFGVAEPTPPTVALRGRVDRPTQYGRFVVYCRNDGRWIVYDPALPFAHRTAIVVETKDVACDAAGRLSEAAMARGEPNAKERKGDLWDWQDPETWNR